MPEVLGRINPDVTFVTSMEALTLSDEERALAKNALEGRLGQIRKAQQLDEQSLEGTYLIAMDDGRKISVAH